jgi:integrase/recombinase XerD
LPVKLSTTISNIQTIPNENNRILVNEFYEFMKSSGTSDKYQNNNLKTIIAFGRFLDPSISFQSITERDQILAFLDTKIKDSKLDPDKRWITTWNDYLGRIKYFFRWLHNTKNSGELLRANQFKEDLYIPITEWKTPSFLKIDKKKTKRLSPYLESELWEKEDILTIVKYDN